MPGPLVGDEVVAGGPFPRLHPRKRAARSRTCGPDLSGYRHFDLLLDYPAWHRHLHAGTGGTGSGQRSDGPRLAATEHHRPPIRTIRPEQCHGRVACLPFRADRHLRHRGLARSKGRRLREHERPVQPAGQVAPCRA